ncbi:SMC-Scp complex subunit ScpB, partial [Candidatus Falkowbacteria bacterium CG23_combo_of_CG06-09_8_20_14_all_49_15]
MDKSLKSKLESLLFIAAKPMPLKQLAALAEAEPAAVAQLGDELVSEYRAAGQGVQIIKNGQQYQMVSAPENAATIQKFIQNETTGELSRPSLEALTIIAYRGPITKLDLDRIRGVNCALIIRNLLLRGLIEAHYRSDRKETYYSVTFDFIRFLGIGEVSQLPDYERLHQDDTIDRVLAGAVPAAETGTDKQNENSENQAEISAVEIVTDEEDE